MFNCATKNSNITYSIQVSYKFSEPKLTPIDKAASTP